MSLSRYWPYRTGAKEAGRKILALLSGLFVGGKAVTTYFNPLEVCSSHLSNTFFRSFTANSMRGNVSSSSSTVIGSSNKVLTVSSHPPMSDQTTGYQLPSNFGDSLFKKTFKYYKQRAIDLDSSEVLDLRVSNEFYGLKCVPIQSTVDISNSGMELNPINEWSVTTMSSRPGLYVLNNVISQKGQLLLMEKCLLDYPEPPNITNLVVDGSYDKANVFHNKKEKLRWVTMGNDYDWTTKLYASSPRSMLPDELSNLSKLVCDVLGIGQMNADAAILNFYPPKGTLSPHVDRSERKIAQPLISISLGQSAIYLCGGLTVDDHIDAFLLNSGDIMVMHGEQRLVYHAVPRIIKTRTFQAPLTTDINKEVVAYANNSRVNVTIRQVD